MDLAKNSSRRPSNTRAATAYAVAVRALSIVASIAFWVLVWFIAAKRIGHEVILPTPAQVLSRLGELLPERAFHVSVANSLFKVVAGLASGILIAVPCATLAARVSAIKVLLDPVIITVRATPVASFIILIWTVLGQKGPSLVPIFISFLMVFPVVYSALLSAIGEVDRGLLEVATVYRFSLAKRLRLIYIPSVFPTVVSACATAAGLAWKAGIAAEVLSQTRDSIGFEIYTSKAHLETTDLFAYTLTVILLSLAIELLLRLARSHALKNGGVKNGK